MSEQRNWSGNVGYGTADVAHPTSVEALQELVAGASRVRALGSRHSFSEVARTQGLLVSTDALPFEIEVDAEAGAVVAPASALYGHVAGAAQLKGLSLHNLGSLPHISVGGACATGTHGSGDGNRVLASAVRAVELVTGTGELRTVQRGEPGFEVAVLGLGAAGVATRITLDAGPTFDVRQDLYDDVPFGELFDDLTGLTGAAYSVSLFTTLQTDVFDQVWLKQVDDGTLAAPAPTFHGGRLADGPRHPVAGMPVEHATTQGRTGSWNRRLPHFRLEHTPSAGEELQSEFLVPRENAVAAWREVVALRDLIAPLLLVSEVRTVARDELWLSPAQGRDVVGVHFTWRLDVPAVHAVLAVLEPRLVALGARPHWGKVFLTPPDQVRALYPHADDATSALAAFDPAGRMRNAYVDAYLPR